MFTQILSVILVHLIPRESIRALDTETKDFQQINKIGEGENQSLHHVCNVAKVNAVDVDSLEQCATWEKRQGNERKRHERKSFHLCHSFSLLVLVLR